MHHIIHPFKLYNQGKGGRLKREGLYVYMDKIRIVV